jgi:hypothetical protein
MFAWQQEKKEEFIFPETFIFPSYTPFYRPSTHSHELPSSISWKSIDDEKYCEIFYDITLE